MSIENQPFRPGPLTLDLGKTGEQNARFVLYDEDRQIALRKNDSSPFLRREELPPGGPAAPQDDLFLGRLGELLLFARQTGEEGLPAPLAWTPLRPFFADFSPGLPQLLARGRHLLHWRRNNLFCGRCGSALKLHSEEAAGFCPSCGLIVYPQISPAVIILITQGDKILLARNSSFKGQMFSLIAGFVEPGETLEQTVIRETREEVGLELSEIRYYKSQPWPFPSSLMCGFIAKCPRGEPLPDGREIAEARWFSREELPEIPGSGSISRELINLYIDKKLAELEKRK